MFSLIKLGLYFIGGVVFGPFLAIWFSFYSDIFHLKIEYVSRMPKDLRKEKFKKGVFLDLVFLN